MGSTLPAMLRSLCIPGCQPVSLQR